MSTLPTQDPRPDLQPFTAAHHQPYTLAGSCDHCALLVHGFPGTPSELAKVGAMLHGAGWSVEGLLLPGFGPELAALPQQTAQSWLDAVLAHLRALRARFARVLLVGNSMGSALALQAAAQVAVEGVLLFSPWWRLHSRALDALAPAVVRAIPTLRPLRALRMDDPRLAAPLADVLPHANLGDPAVQAHLRAFALPTRVLAEVREVGRRGRAAAPRVHAPTLIVQAAGDLLVNPAETATLARALPNLAGIVMVQGDHEFAHLKQPQQALIGSLVTAFAAQVAAGQAAAVLAAAPPHAGAQPSRAQPGRAQRNGNGA